jgi:short-subunit dehydrogenase involved in D-alanine esterification of teichoic acids
MHLNVVGSVFDVSSSKQREELIEAVSSKFGAQLNILVGILIYPALFI